VLGTVKLAIMLTILEAK